MTQENANSWKQFSTKLNYFPEHSKSKLEYLGNNLDSIKKLKAEDIDDIDVQPSSLILKTAKAYPNILNEVLNGWKENKELNEIFYRIAGEANPQSIANTLSGLKKVDNK